jgi:flagellar export protein FliJ
MTLPLRTIRKIHSIKETLAAQAEWEYAAALQQQMAVRNALGVLQQELDDASGLFGTRQSNGLSGAELHEWNRWVDTLRTKIEAQHQVCEQADLYAEECRGRLMERHQDKEVWQKLRERNAAQFEQQFRKQEQTELDEVGSRNRKRV